MTDTPINLTIVPKSYFKMGFEFTLGAAVAIGVICLVAKLVTYLVEAL